MRTIGDLVLHSFVSQYTFDIHQALLIPFVDSTQAPSASVCFSLNFHTIVELAMSSGVPVE